MPMTGLLKTRVEFLCGNVELSNRIVADEGSFRDRVSLSAV